MYVRCLLMVLGVPVDPAAHLRHPQPDAVVLEQRRHRRVLAAVERPLVLPRPRSRPTPDRPAAPPGRRPAGAAPTAASGSPPHRRTPPRSPPCPAASITACCNCAPATSPDPASPGSTPARKTRTADSPGSARRPGRPGSAPIQPAHHHPRPGEPHPSSSWQPPLLPVPPRRQHPPARGRTPPPENQLNTSADYPLKPAAHCSPPSRTSWPVADRKTDDLTAAAAGGRERGQAAGGRSVLHNWRRTWRPHPGIRSRAWPARPRPWPRGPRARGVAGELLGDPGASAATAG